jgi:hypothetical protein
MAHAYRDWLTNFPNLHANHLKAMAVEYQKGQVEVNSIVIGMAHNHHRHTKTLCFPKSAKADKSSNDFNKWKRKHVCKANCECRYLMPRARQQCTAIQESTTVPVKWYSWDGTTTDHHVMEVIVKRHLYNAFQNVCCPAFSNSMLTCNTNISPMHEGPLSHYQFKYHVKDTQDQDTEEYDCISHAVRKALIALEESPRDSERSESL